MKDQAEGLMEEEIVREEQSSSDSLGTQSQSPKTGIQKLMINPRIIGKVIVEHIRKPKIITLIILFLAATVLYLGLNLLSQKNETELVDNTPQMNATSSPGASVNPQFVEIANEINNFKNKLDNWGIDSSQLAPPNVDLNISF